MIESADLKHFYDAVVQNNQLAISQSSKPIRYRLIRYTQGMMGAQRSDAEDIVQNVFINTINQIGLGNISDPERIGAYMVKAVRNQYISFSRRIQLDELNDEPGYFTSLAEQIDALVEHEKMQALRDCLDEMDDSNRGFMRFWLARPDEKAEMLAEQFKITVSNVFTKKHRLIKVLSECVKGKTDA